MKHHESPQHAEKDPLGKIPDLACASSGTATAAPISLGKFLDQTGASPVTAWRWEKRGWLRTVRIAGRKYITADELRQFNRRLEAGEFAGTTQKPVRNSTPGK